MQVRLQRKFQAGLADGVVHVVAFLFAVRPAAQRAVPFLSVDWADRAEQMRRIGRIVLAHSFALYVYALVILMVLLDVRDQVH